MMKFFRKHNRKLLAVFMALLLIVWLGGSALQGLVSPSTEHRVIATTMSEDIVELDQRIAAFETELLEGVGLDWKRPWAFNRAVRHEPLGVMEWILLTREAQAWGMMPRQIEVDSFLSRSGITPDYVHRLANRRDVKAASVYAAIGKYIGVFNTLSLTVASATRSEAATRVAALAELEKVKVNLVTIDAKPFIDPSEEFTEEEIQGQFERYRNEQDGRGIRFAYYQPPGIKLQYFRIDVNTVADNVRIREKTLNDRAREFWREYKTLPVFLRPEESPDADVQPADEEPAGPPEPPRPLNYETFEEARDTAMGIVRLEIAHREIRKVADWLLQELSDPWFALPAGEDGYKICPEELLREDYYASVLERLPAGLRYGDAVSVEVTEFFQQADASRLPGIGLARVQLGANQYVVANVAFHVQTVEPLPIAGGAETSLYLALGQSSAVAFTGYPGHTYIYRVVGVEPAGPAESVDAVRDKVIEDLRLLSAYRKAEQAADRLVASVTFDGLEAAFNANDELQGMTDPAPAYYSPPPFGHRQPGSFVASARGNTVFVAGLGVVDETFIEACFAFGEQPVGMRLGPILLDERGVIAVVEWVEKSLLRVDGYEKERRRIARQMNDAVVARKLSQWLDPVRIRDRNNFAAAAP